MPPSALLARHVTVYQQWSFIRRWAHDPSLREAGVEWFLHNDAPDDPCPPDLRDALARLGVQVSEGRFNLGRSGARNALARRSAAPFLEFIDGDDRPLPLGPNLGLLRPEVGLVSFPIGTYRLKADREELGMDEKSGGFACPGLFQHLVDVSPLPATLIYARPLFDDCEGFDGRFDTIEDLHLLWKLDRLAPTLAFAPTPKQRYFHTDWDQRTESDIRSLHWIRFFRHASTSAQRLGQPTHAIGRFIETAELNTVQALLRDLLRHVPKAPLTHPIPAPLAAILREVESKALPIYVQAKTVLFRARPPSLRLRLSEALKWLVGHPGSRPGA
jgi:hypothetical protein